MKQLTFEIEGYDKKFHVKELSVRQILSIFDSIGDKDISLSTFKEMLDEKFLSEISNLSYSDLLDMAPSDLLTVWEKFKEVNQAFFGVARKAGIPDIVRRIREAFVEDLSRLSVISLKQDMGKGR